MTKANALDPGSPPQAFPAAGRGLPDSLGERYSSLPLSRVAGARTHGTLRVRQPNRLEVSHG